MLFLRFAVAAVVMVGVMVARREPWPRGRVLLGCALLGGIGYVGQSAAFFTALLYAPAGLVSLLLYLYPAIVLLLGVALLGERITRARVGALALAVVGTALTIGPESGGQVLGVVLGVAAALIYSVYILAGSRVTPRAGAIPASTVIITSAAVVYGLAAAATRPALPAGTEGVVAIIGIALVATVLAIVAFFAGMARVGPTDASTLSSVEPAVTVLLAAVVLGESLTPLRFAGGALILVAVVLLARSGREPVPAAASTAR